MFVLENNNIINTYIYETILITIYTNVINDIYIYRIFINNEYITSGKYIKNSGLLYRYLYYQNISLLLTTDQDNDVVISFEEVNV